MPNGWAMKRGGLQVTALSVQETNAGCPEACFAVSTRPDLLPLSIQLKEFIKKIKLKKMIELLI